MIIGETIKVGMTYQTFGCERNYFERYIQNKDLTITAVGNKFIFVVDENSQSWSISRQDLIKEIDKDVL